MLFSEIDHHNIYGVHVYSGKKDKANFLSISNLFHPSTIDGSFIHSGTGQVYGYKVKNENTGRMEWNILPHQNRIVQINEDVLKILARTFENSDDWEGVKLVSIHAQEIVSIIRKIGLFKNTVQEFENKVSICWNETGSVRNNTLKRETTFPTVSMYEMIYSGPHIFVGNPLYKTPREICSQNSHYDIINLLTIKEDFVTRTNFLPVNLTAGYGSILNGFPLDENNFNNWLDYYKLAFRTMLSPTGERTLSGAIIPPKTAHIHGVISVIFKIQDNLIEFSGLSHSVVFDFYIKTIGTSNLSDERLESLPLGIDPKYHTALFARTLQLNCLNKYYAPLWEESYREEFKKEQ